MKFPYPILDWQNDKYPSESDLNLDEWKWEFLRRNPEYQKLYRKFDNCPDTRICQDGTETNKNGKWKGAPWANMIFGVDCFFYADPPPKPGEYLDEYECRTHGDVMPFAEYITKVFKINMRPVKPSEALPEDCYFSDEFGADSIPPWIGGLETLIRPGDGTTHSSHASRMSIVFDVHKPIGKQLKIAQDILEDAQKDMPISTAGRKMPSIVLYKYPLYIRILDALANGVSKQKIASVVFPGQDDSWPDRTITKRVAANVKAAEQLRDHDYWKLGF